MNTPTWAEPLFARTIVSLESGCWLWNTSVLPKNGYPIWYGPRELAPAGKSRFAGAHRWAYIATHGSIPEGLEIDHLCNMRYCINPEHLEAVTGDENQRRRSERQTHCKYGHERTEKNSYRTKSGARQCRPCRTAYVRRERVAA